MKLSQLQEARYHGTHPVVDAIKNVIDNYQKAHWMDDFWSVDEHDVEAIVDGLTQLYGKPDTFRDDDLNRTVSRVLKGGDRSWTWNIPVEQDYVRSGKDYKIYLSYDVDEDPQYGVDLIGGPEEMK